MVPLLYLALGIVAAATIFGLAVNNRASGKILSKDAFAKREAQMALVTKMRDIGHKIQADPTGPDSVALRAQFDALSAEYKSTANASLGRTKNALRPIMTMNYIVASVGGAFSLLAIGYLILTQGGPIFIGAGVVILFVVGYGAIGMLRAKRGWDFVTKDRSAAPTHTQNTDSPE